MNKKCCMTAYHKNWELFIGFGYVKVIIDN